MKRKTSSLPTRIFKYHLLPPTGNAEELEKSFAGARRYYNSMITIERDRRRQYRDLRSQMFPELAGLEEKARVLDARLQGLRAMVNVSKAKARSRSVSPINKKEIDAARVELKAIRTKLKEEREKITQSKKMDSDSQKINEIANEAVKKLRPTLYHGTYNLVEGAVRSAAGKKTDPSYDTDPDHAAKGRVGVHFEGGVGVADLANGKKLQISPMPTFRVRPNGTMHARGKAARTTLRFRIGSSGKGNKIPTWATFPMVMDRPLPEDALIKDAYVTRRPRSVRDPWEYSLCIVMESQEFERKTSTDEQTGTTKINFGWLKKEGGLRVATVASDKFGVVEVLLPDRVLTGFQKCADLQGIIDVRFNEAKKLLSAWISENKPTLPKLFVEDFANVGLWKSKHRLAELVWYWRSHRIRGDETIFPQMSNLMPKGEDPKTWAHGWLDKYRHLQDWLDNERRYLQDWRLDFYRREAKRICTTSETVVIDAFKISSVARKPNAEVEETGGKAARTNRVIASPSMLRDEIQKAAAKFHCQIDVVKTKDGTRRCDVCGHVAKKTIAKVIHKCEQCGAVWDRDVNNTDNLDTEHSSGKVATLLKPAEVAENGDILPSRKTNFATARKQVANLGESIR